MPPSSPTPRALDELADDPSSRKRFLRMMGGGAAASGLAVLLAACGDDEKKKAPTTGGGSVSPARGASGGNGSTGGGDIEILNYALTLEYIEARYYREAIESGMLTDKKVVALAKSIGETEQEHVEVLTATIKEMGGVPVKAPRTRFDLVIKGGPEMILMVAATVENLGAAAYLGQAPRIESKEVLAAALAIHSVEARHAAALNELVGRQFKGGGPLEGSVPDGPFAKPMTMEQVLEQAKPFLAS